MTSPHLSPYTGSITAETNPQERKVPGARIIKMSVGGADNNVYLVQCSATGKALLIDAANDAADLVALINQEAPQLELIVTTHEHIDHWWALPDVVAATSVRTAAHQLAAVDLPVQPDQPLNNGDTIAVGDLVFEVIHARGHTPGSVILALTDGDANVHLFTGDSLFPGGVGKTPGDAEFTSLLDDIEERVFNRYPDSAVVYPGHGNDTTLGNERSHLPEWRHRGW